VLVLSAYDATSHRLWRERLAALFPEFSWTQLALPPRHFDWRLRSNGLHWGLSDSPELEADYDLILATSMVDLATLRGLRPTLAAIATVVYFHENQFFYPANSDPAANRQANIEPLLVPVYAALSADAVVFNSAFNRDTFLAGVSSLFARLPDDLPAPGRARLQASVVLPVPVAIETPEPIVPEKNPEKDPGLEPERDPERAPKNDPEPVADCLDVLWNHRWEYDKGPALLLAVVTALHQQNLPVRLHLCGQQFRRQPDEFPEIRRLTREICARHQLAPGHTGFIDQTTEYRQLMSRCDVVLSTADHEFQGLGIQEAVLQGCSPLAPDDLAYPEYLPAACRYPRLDSITTTATEVAGRIAHLCALKASGQALPTADLGRYCGAAIRQQYLSLFSAAVDGKNADAEAY